VGCHQPPIPSKACKVFEINDLGWDFGSYMLNRKAAVRDLLAFRSSFGWLECQVPSGSFGLTEDSAGGKLKYTSPHGVSAEPT
jgi:hypothetical protein